MPTRSRAGAWSRFAAVTLVCAMVAPAGRADPRPPELDRLRREAGALPTGALVARLRSPDRAVRLAAIAAASAAPDRAELLAELAVLAGGWDRSLAAPAARAARTIARGLVASPAELGTRSDDPAPGEVPDLDDDELAATLDAWRALAMRADRWADVRVHALEIVVALTELRRIANGEPAASYDVAGLAHDVDPEVRRAALELIVVPAPVDVRAVLIERLAADPALTVRLAAAQALCADLPRDAPAVLTALGADGRAALRALVTAPSATTGSSATTSTVPAPGAAAVDIARCLAADADPASVRAVESLRHRAPRALRPILDAVVAAVAARALPPP